MIKDLKIVVENMKKENIKSRIGIINTFKICKDNGHFEYFVGNITSKNKKDRKTMVYRKKGEYVYWDILDNTKYFKTTNDILYGSNRIVKVKKIK